MVIAVFSLFFASHAFCISIGAWQSNGINIGAWQADDAEEEPATPATPAPFFSTFGD